MQLADVEEGSYLLFYGFNPLFIGSKDATVALCYALVVSTTVSIPFSSGQRMQRPVTVIPPRRITAFQSPFHRVKGCNYS